MAALGLQAVGNKVYRNGQPWRHVGVTHSALFQRELYTFPNMPNPGLGPDLDAIQARGIKLLKVAFGWFDYASWRDYYWNAKPAYWVALTRVLDAMAARDIMCVANMGLSLPGLLQLTYLTNGGVTIPPSRIADRTSPAHTIWVDYITEFVTRYKNHPAIGMWTFGNEVSAKLGNEYHPSWAIDGTFNSAITFGTKPEGGTYAPGDKMGPAIYQEWMQQFVDLVHSLDPHARVVLSGNPVGNSFAVAQIRNANLTADSYDDWDGRPDTASKPWIAYRDQACDAICTHTYPLVARTGDSQWYSDGDRTYGQHLGYQKAWADQVGKPLVLAEFGATRYGSEVDPVSSPGAMTTLGTIGSAVTEASLIAEALAAIESNDIPVALCWNWDGQDLVDANSNGVIDNAVEPYLWPLTHPTRTYILDAIQALNARRG